MESTSYLLQDEHGQEYALLTGDPLSTLKARGYDKVVNMEGSVPALAETAVPSSAYVCPSTLK